MSSGVVLYGADGKPLDMSVLRAGSAPVRKSLGTFLAALATVTAPPSLRATQPIVNDAYIYAALYAIASNSLQAPFCVMRETDDSMAYRREAAKKAGLKWTGPRAGVGRRANERKLAQKTRRYGAAIKGAEPIPDHPMTDVLRRPNPFMTSVDLWTATIIWRYERGECDWVCFGDQGRLGVLDVPTEIYPVPGDWLVPEWENGQLVSYRYTRTSYNSYGLPIGTFRLLPHEVIPFRAFNPLDPTRGLTPLSPLASTIEIDQMADRYTRSQLANQAVPAGMLVDERGDSTIDPSSNPKEIENLRNHLRETYTGADNAFKTAILPPGLKWVQIAREMADMEFPEQRKWSREAKLAVLRVPKSILSVTEDLNYSTQISQDFNFWDKCIIPLLREFETVLDATLFEPMTDDIFGGFDFTQVEGLRAGMADKLANVEKLTGDKIHMPPRQAFAVVGLDIEPYDHDDVALVSPILIPIDDLMMAVEEPPPAPPTPAPAPGADPNADPSVDNPGSPPPEEKPPANPPAPSKAAEAARFRAVNKAVKKERYWTQIIAELQHPLERTFAPPYRRWVAQMRAEQLALFDKNAGRLSRSWAMMVGKDLSPEDVDGLVLDLGDMTKAMSKQLTPLYSGSIERVFSFTEAVDCNGVTVFNVDDPVIQATMDAVENKVIGTVPANLQKSIRKSIRTGIDKGENLAEIRARVGQQLDVSASSSRTLSFARTESARFMNASRDSMFKLQGFDAGDWTTAQDEHVRDSHKVYGDAGPKPFGFNYCLLSHKSGKLLYPNDPEASADETINCRCCIIPGD